MHVCRQAFVRYIVWVLNAPTWFYMESGSEKENVAVWESFVAISFPSPHTAIPFLPLMPPLFPLILPSIPFPSCCLLFPSPHTAFTSLPLKAHYFRLMLPLLPITLLSLHLPSHDFPSPCTAFPSFLRMLASFPIMLPSLYLPHAYLVPSPPPMDISQQSPQALLTCCFNVPHFVQCCTPLPHYPQVPRPNAS